MKEPLSINASVLARDASVMPKLPDHLIAALDAGLLDNGRMRSLPAADLRLVPHMALQQWAQLRGRYQFPTVELIEWLRARIAGRKCVEIGAGYGDIGRNVGGVTLTDSYFQTAQEMRHHYGKVLGQHAISPPPDVMRREGAAAIWRYQPAVCLACWVTQKFEAGDEAAQTGSCVGGVDFHKLLSKVGELVFVGNAKVHRDMRLLAEPHEEYAFPWIVSRATDQSLNRIWVWKGGLDASA